MTKGKLFIITGTSAVGKTSIAELVLKKNKKMVRSLTFTDRPRRGQEKDGRDYHFISPAEFKKKIARSGFLEWANNYGHRYGTDKKQIAKLLGQGKNVLVVIDIKGALNIKKQRPKAITIFILPESINQLAARFKKRHDTSPADVKKRLKIARWELVQSPKCDYQIVNPEGQINSAVKAVLEVIKAITDRSSRS